jgi:hypothetical protein
MQYVPTNLDAHIRANITQAVEDAVQSVPPPLQDEFRLEITKVVSAQFGIDSSPSQG